MKILLAASEIATLAQTGGLADIMRSLPIALKAQGIDIALSMPKYRHVEVDGEELGKLQIPIEDKVVKGRIIRSTLPDTDIPVFFIDQEDYFDRENLYTEKGRDYPDNLERFTFFCRAILDLIERGVWKPDLIHANDWQTALLPTYLKTIYRKHAVLGKIKTLFTIHNMAYQGLFPIFLYPVLNLSWDYFNLSELEFYNQINLLKGGIVFADAVNTVSPNYAKEIQTQEFGCGLEGLLLKNQKKLTGILNRVDYAQWSPDQDAYIPMRYNASNVQEGKAKNKQALLEEFGLPAPEDRRPLFGVVSRITPQKGCDLIASIIPTLIRRGAQVVILGTGDPKIEDLLKSMERQYPDACGVQIEYNTEMSHLIEAGSDMFLMPSRFEPCGLNQMYSLLYGTIPIVHSIGGLADTVTDYHESNQGNGFTFDDESTGAFMEACDRAITVFEDEKAWSILVQRAMQTDFSWSQSAKEYIDLYRSIF